MKNTKDMTVGSVTGAIIAFSLPILFGNLFQQAYNLADTAIAGHFWAMTPCPQSAQQAHFSTF